MTALVIGLPLVGGVVVSMMGGGLGYRGVRIVGVVPMMMAIVVGVGLLWEVGICGNRVQMRIGEWISVGVLGAEYGVRVDSISVLMVVLITVVGSMVLIYSGEYMKGDKDYGGFVRNVNLFCMFMLVLVLGDNMVVMFIGWEGVGVMSYLLIAYWGASIANNKASVQAVVLNRVGDVGVVVGMMVLYGRLGTMGFEEMVVLGVEDKVVVGCILLGVVSKSAQFGLHLWLPNAMAAPTPISALLHAATMVTAGVYILVRISAVVEASGMGEVVGLVGGVTVLVMGTVGIVQNDMKRVIAYSTGSQLGYMVMGCGLGVYEVSMYHLVNHGFFKALLFLSAGMVIHGLRDEQDMRRMGGMTRVMPVAYMGTVVGSVALMGVPMTSGFDSKDRLVEVAWVKAMSGEWMGSVMVVVCELGVLCTAVYSIRLIRLVYWERVNSRQRVVEGADEGSYGMLWPVVVLGVLAVVSGYMGREMVGSGAYWGGSVGSMEEQLVDCEWVPIIYKQIALGLTVVGAMIGWRMRRVYHMGLYKMLVKRWYVDKVYNEVVGQGLMRVGYEVTYKGVDKGLWEVLGPSGVERGVDGMARRMEKKDWLLVAVISVGLIVGVP